MRSRGAVIRLRSWGRRNRHRAGKAPTDPAPSRRAPPWRCSGFLPVGWRRRPGSSALRGRGIRPIPGYAHRPRASHRGARGRACRAGECEPGEARRRYHAVGGTCDVYSAAYHRLSPAALRWMARHVGDGPRSGRATRRTSHHTRTLGALLPGLGAGFPPGPAGLLIDAHHLQHHDNDHHRADDVHDRAHVSALPGDATPSA